MPHAVLFVGAAATLVEFWKVDPFAGKLMLPYLAFTCYANALNYWFWKNNPGVSVCRQTGQGARVWPGCRSRCIVPSLGLLLFPAHPLGAACTCSPPCAAVLRLRHQAKGSLRRAVAQALLCTVAVVLWDLLGLGPWRTQLCS